MLSIVTSGEFSPQVQWQIHRSVASSSYSIDLIRIEKADMENRQRCVGHGICSVKASNLGSLPQVTEETSDSLEFARSAKDLPITMDHEVLLKEDTC